MFLVELVMQGVRGIRNVARLRFQSGFNLVSAGNESGKTCATDAILRLLFPSGDVGVMDRLTSRSASESSRAALVVYSDDGAYYRVIQDFSKRAVNLSKYNPAAKDFALVNKDWESTARFFSGLVGGISEDEYGRLFVLRRDHYAGTGLLPAAPAAVLRRTVTPKAPAPASGKRSAQEARLTELRQALAKAEEAADAEYQLQSARLRLEEVQKKFDGLGDLNQRGADLDAQLEEFRGFETLPENVAELIEEHEERQSKKMAKTDELTQEIEGLKLQIEQIPPMKVLSDKVFLLGILVGLAAVAAGLFLPTLIPEHYFPIGVLASLAIVAVGWYRGSRKSAERGLLMKEVEALEASLAEVEKSFEVGGSEIMGYMQATGSSTTAELKDKLGNYRYFLSMKEDFLQQRQHMTGGTSYEALGVEYENVQQQIRDLEKKAAALAPYALDSYSLRQDIERIEMEMGGGSSAPFFSGGEEFSGDVGFAAPDAPAVRGDGFVTELAVASRVGGIELDTLIPAVAAAAQRNLSAVTGGKYVRIEVGQEGGPAVHTRDDSIVNLSELSHGTRDLLYFCVRTGLVEALAGKLRLPLILDDPLAGFDPVRQQAACQILRSLGAKTQVILFTSNPGLKAAGDVAAELK
jgi:hypothetical protein